MKININEPTAITEEEIRLNGLYETSFWAPGCAPSEVRAGAKWPVLVEGLGGKSQIRFEGMEIEARLVGYSEQGYIVVSFSDIVEEVEITLVEGVTTDSGIEERVRSVYPGERTEFGIVPEFVCIDSYAHPVDAGPYGVGETTSVQLYTCCPVQEAVAIGETSYAYLLYTAEREGFVQGGTNTHYSYSFLPLFGGIITDEDKERGDYSGVIWS